MPRFNKLVAACVLLLFSFACLAAQQDSPDTSKAAIVKGTVTDSITGLPVAHVHVVLTGFLTTNVFGAISNSDGGFSMLAVPPDTYSVSATHRLYLVTRKLEGPAQINIEANENVPALNIQLVPASVISGRIVDEKHHPVAGASVRAFGAVSQGSAVSDDRGRFRIAGLSRDRYLIKATSNDWPVPPEIRTDGSVEVNYGTTYYPDTLNPGSAQQAQTEPGREMSDIVIEMKTTPITRVSGTVVGAPSGTGNVRLAFRSNSSTRNIQLDPLNHFTLWRVDRGTHQLIANTQGDDMKFASLLIDVTDSNLDNLVLSLQPRFELKGNVGRIPSFNRAEKDNTGRERRSIILASAEPMTGVGGVSNFDHAEVDANGDFTLSNIVPGRYFVRLESDRKEIYVRDVHAASLKLDRGILDLRNGPPSQPLSVELGTDGGQITVTIQHADGTPALAWVELLRQDSDGYKLLQQSTAFKAPCTFTSIPPGIYLLLAFDEASDSDMNTAEFAAIYRGLMRQVIVGSGDSVTKILKLPGNDGSR